MIEAGFHPVPPGHVAAIVTHLERRVPPETASVPFPDGATLRRVETPDPHWYRDLFARVGGQDWLWSSRLRLPMQELVEILHDPDVEVHAVEAGGRAEGLLELNFRASATPELAFFGLTPALQGQGIGRALMQAALAQAFARPIEALTVHTCTLDSPVALPFYIRSGFVPVRREVEVMADPRLNGVLPEDAAPHHPVLP